MPASRIFTALATGTLLLAGGLLVTTPADAVPTVTGCPSGYLTLSVTDLIAQGYGDFPTRIDVNGDGVICGKPLSAPVQERFCAERPGGCTVPIIYTARDNTLTPAY